MDKLATDLILTKKLIDKLNLKPDTLLYVQLGTIVDTQDDLQLGRVKVQLDVRGNNATRWSYFLGYPSGQVPAEYVRNGTRVACIPAYGNAEELLIIGTFGQGSSPNPVTLPVISLDDRTPLPECNERMLGSALLLENINGSDVNICIRSKNKYSWRKLHSSLITENQGLSSSEAQAIIKGNIPDTFSQDRIIFSNLPTCDETKQGQEIPFSERDEWRQFKIICKKDENGEFRWKPSSTIPIFTRNSIPNCTEEYHGTLIQLDDGANSYLAYCARSNGDMKWMKYGSREAIRFNNATQNDKVNNKDPHSPASLFNVIPEAIKLAGKAKQIADSITPVSAQDTQNIVNGVVKDATSKDSSLTGIKGSWADVISKNTGLPVTGILDAIQSGTQIAGALGVDNIPKNVPKEISNVLNSKEPLNQIIKSTASVVSSYSKPEVSAVLYGVASGGWQGALDAATTYGLKSLPPEFQGTFGQFIKNAGGIDKLPGPLKDVANAALGNTNVGLKDLSKYLLSGSLFKDLSNVNFDLSKINLSIDPTNLGNFVKSILPGNIDLSNLKLDAGTLSKSLSSVLSYVDPNLASQFSSTFSGGLGAQFASTLVGGANKLFKLGGENPCDCSVRKCNIFKDPVNGNVSLVEDCKIVMCGQTTYNSSDIISAINSNDVAKNAFSQNNTQLGKQIIGPESIISTPLSGDQSADLTRVILNTRTNNLGDYDRWISCADKKNQVQEMSYNSETISKTFKATDNNITQIELTDRKLIDGQLAIIREIFGCDNPDGGVFGVLNKSLSDISTSIRELLSYVQTLDAVKQGGSANAVSTPALQKVDEIALGINSISKLTKSIACQIKADFIQPASNINTALQPGFPAGSYNNPFDKTELEKQLNNFEDLSKENLISSVFDGVPDPRIGYLPNRVSTLSDYQNKDKVDSILDQVFANPNGIPQDTAPENPPISDPNLINDVLNGLNPNEESGRFAGEKDCR